MSLLADCYALGLACAWRLRLMLLRVYPANDTPVVWTDTAEHNPSGTPRLLLSCTCPAMPRILGPLCVAGSVATPSPVPRHPIGVESGAGTLTK